MTRLKFWLWRVGIWPDRCPWHGTPLMHHGFEGHNERWTCETETGCRFNGS